jgi:pseudaminic acid biosynthesis-associated methylase
VVKTPKGSSHESVPAEAERLEDLWAGEFGDAYVARNIEAGEGRDRFWAALLERYPVSSVLEVGCNVGANLQWLVRLLDSSHVHGVDVNEQALTILRRRLPGVHAIISPARSLPFEDGSMDLAFTSGVLIHQPDSALRNVMSELVRVARTFVLAIEYHADETVEVPYRGQSGALFKRDYAGLYQSLFPQLEWLDGGFLARDDGWDDATWCLLRKQATA